jgi:amino acid transporter
MLPFSKTWSSVNEKTATPIFTILAVGVFAIMINLLSGGFVANVLAVVNVALYLTYGSTCVAVLIAHRRGTIPDAPAGYFSLGRWLVPVAVTCVIFSVAVIVFMIGPASSHTVLWYALGFEAAGAVWYLAAVRHPPRGNRARRHPRLTEGPRTRGRRAPPRRGVRAPPWSRLIAGAPPRCRARRRAGCGR